jgi:hypothetical protein
VLKFLVVETAAIVCVPAMGTYFIKKQNRQLKTTGSNTPSTTYVRIEGTHTIAAVSPTKNFNT